MDTHHCAPAVALPAPCAGHDVVIDTAWPETPAAPPLASMMQFSSVLPTHSLAPCWHVIVLLSALMRALPYGTISKLMMPWPSPTLVP